MSMILINIFIIVYLFVAVSWSCPPGTMFFRLSRPVSKPIRWIGLWHSWAMFAPEPILTERRLSIELTYSDGSVDSFDLFRAHEANLFDAFINTRERKYQSELAKQNEKVHRPAICRYYEKHYAREEEKPVKSELVVLKRWIRDPDVSEENEIERIVAWRIHL